MAPTLAAHRHLRHACMQVDIEYTVGRQVRRRRDVFIGRMPIMLRSSRCVLHGASDSELVACNECPLDPGGYFVIRGTEKVILIQEQLSKNRILVETDSDRDVMASVTSTDSERKTMTKLRHKRGVFQLQHNIFEKPVNLALVFRALGVESDQVPPPLPIGSSHGDTAPAVIRHAAHGTHASRGHACRAVHADPGVPAGAMPAACSRMRVAYRARMCRSCRPLRASAQPAAGTEQQTRWAQPRARCA